MLDKTEIIGYLGNSATVAEINQKKVVNFTCCVTTKWKDAQGILKERQKWYSCSWWLQNTNIAQYLKKGTLVYISGEVEAKTYTNKQTNEVTGQLSLRVNQLQLLGGAKPTTNTTQVDDLNNSEIDPPF